eukprot:5737942-Prymnesium_polylepis.1
MGAGKGRSFECGMWDRVGTGRWACALFSGRHGVVLTPMNLPAGPKRGDGGHASSGPVRGAA